MDRPEGLSRCYISPLNMPIHQRILVTGGAGFVGSSVALALKRIYPQTKVTAFDNLHRRGSELNLRRLRDADVVFAHGDIRSLADLTGLPEPPILFSSRRAVSILTGA